MTRTKPSVHSSSFGAGVDAEQLDVVAVQLVAEDAVLIDVHGRAVLAGLVLVAHMPQGVHDHGREAGSALAGERLSFA